MTPYLKKQDIFPMEIERFYSVSTQHFIENETIIENDSH